MGKAVKKGFDRKAMLKNKVLECNLMIRFSAGSVPDRVGLGSTWWLGRSGDPALWSWTRCLFKCLEIRGSPKHCDICHSWIESWGIQERCHIFVSLASWVDKILVYFETIHYWHRSYRPANDFHQSYWHLIMHHGVIVESGDSTRCRGSVWSSLRWHAVIHLSPILTCLIGRGSETDKIACGAGVSVYAIVMGLLFQWTGAATTQDDSVRTALIGVPD